MILQYTPLVTIVIPVYNGEKYVAQAIESALAQTYKKIEIVVVNDGSPDNSEDIIKPYLDRVRYFKKKNGGVSTALNYAIKNAKGEWISWLSHDDLYLPQKIEKQILRLNAILAKNPGCDIEKYVLSCQDQRIDENGKVLPHRGSLHPEYRNPYELIAKEVVNYTIGGCTVFAAKRAYVSVGGFDESNRTISDADMWFKLIRNGYIFDFSNEILVQSRYHRDMVSIRREPLVNKEKQIFYSDIIKTISPHVDDSLKEAMALSMIRSNNEFAAKEALVYCSSKRSFFFLSVLRARCYSKIRHFLRYIYRKIRWR